MEEEGWVDHLICPGWVAKGYREAVHPRASHRRESSRLTPAGGASGLPLLLELGGQGLYPITSMLEELGEAQWSFLELRSGQIFPGSRVRLT